MENDIRKLLTSLQAYKKAKDYRRQLVDGD